MNTKTMTCAECDTSGYRHGEPNYDHVHRVDQLPRAIRQDSVVRASGWAVEVHGRIGGCVAFFNHVEPAYAFGRAGRMSSVDISGWGIFKAVREARYDDGEGADVITLYLGEAVRDHDAGELDILKRWVGNVNPQSSHYLP